MAAFTVTIPTTTAWDVMSALAEHYGYTYSATGATATKQTQKTAITKFLCNAIAGELEARAKAVLAKRSVKPLSISIAPG